MSRILSKFAVQELYTGLIDEDFDWEEVQEAEDIVRCEADVVEGVCLYGLNTDGSCVNRHNHI